MIINKLNEKIEFIYFAKFNKTFVSRLLAHFVQYCIHNACIYIFLNIFQDFIKNFIDISINNFIDI